MPYKANKQNLYPPQRQKFDILFSHTTSREHLSLLYQNIFIHCAVYFLMGFEPLALIAPKIFYKG